MLLLSEYTSEALTDNSPVFVTKTVPIIPTMSPISLLIKTHNFLHQ